MGNDLLAFRNAVRNFYQKHQQIIEFIFKFVLFFAAYARIVNTLDYVPVLGSFIMKLGFGFIGAVLPPVLTIFLCAVIALYEVYSKSMFIAAVVFAVFIVLYCFAARFSGKAAWALVAVPLLWKYNLQFFVPVLLGMTAGPLAIFPMGVGVAVYYVFVSVIGNVGHPAVKTSDEIFELIIGFIHELLDCKEMIVVIVIFSVVLVAMWFVRQLRFDYSFEITIALGGALLCLGFFAANLKVGTDFAVSDVVFGSCVAMFTVYVLQFFRMALNYSGVEYVRFEDDDYYYYVYAVPKLKDRFAKRQIRKNVKETAGASEKEKKPAKPLNVDEETAEVVVTKPEAAPGGNTDETPIENTEAAPNVKTEKAAVAKRAKKFTGLRSLFGDPAPKKDTDKEEAEMPGADGERLEDILADEAFEDRDDIVMSDSVFRSVFGALDRMKKKDQGNINDNNADKNGRT